MADPQATEAPRTMSIDEYQAIIGMLAAWARVVATIDLPALQRQMISARDFGCFFDPTAWNQKHMAMKQDLELVEAFLPARALGVSVIKDRTGG